MKNLNLLFIEGNRTKIDNSNVVESYNKIKAWGFIETMPIEYFPMEEAKNKLGGRKLYRPTITRKKGEGSATISNFEIRCLRELRGLSSKSRKLHCVRSPEYTSRPLHRLPDRDGPVQDGT